MSLSILNNISALTAQNQLSITQKNLQTTLTQLSSGLKINTGADDAAGLSIANGMQANIAALTQSAQNATNGTGMLQTADGALSQITSLLNRAVTLATEASNGGLNATQSSALDTEFKSILNEIDSIGVKTTFNGSAIFQDGTTFNYNQVAASISGTRLTRATVVDTSALAITVGGSSKTVTALQNASTTVGDLIDGINGDATLNLAASLSSDGRLIITDTKNEATDLVSGTDKLTVSGLVGSSFAAQSLDGTKKIATYGSGLTGSTAIDATGLTLSFDGAAKSLAGLSAVTGAKTVDDLMTAINANSGTLKMSVVLTGGSLVVTSTETVTGAGLAVGGLTTADPTVGNSKDNVSEVFQSDSTDAGVSKIQTVLNKLDSQHLNGIDLRTGFDLSTTTAAQKTLVQINTAIAQVAALRGTIGANINQLSAAASVMSTQSQNLKSAMSGITDADVATTVANMTKFNILQSTGMAALQQANQAQQSVLKLLQ